MPYIIYTLSYQISKMITNIIVCRVICSGCKTYIDSPSDWIQAKKMIKDKGWLWINYYTQYCPNCYTLDEKGHPILKKRYDGENA